MKKESDNLSINVHGKSHRILQVMRTSLRMLGAKNQLVDKRRHELLYLLKEHSDIITALEKELRTLKNQENEQLDQYLEAYGHFRNKKREIEGWPKPKARRSKRL